MSATGMRYRFISLASERRASMAKVVHCDCGYVARGESDEELIQVVQEHAKETHDMDLSREQILSMAKPE